MHPFAFFLLLADRSGHLAHLRLNRTTKQWERFVPEFGGGRWEPFLGIDWPAPSATALFELGPVLTSRAAAER